MSRAEIPRLPPERAHRRFGNPRHQASSRISSTALPASSSFSFTFPSCWVANAPCPPSVRWTSRIRSVRFGNHRLWSHYQHQPVARGDGVADLLVKRQIPRGHRDPVEPDLEPAGGQVIVESADERLVIAAGIGEEDFWHRARPRNLSVCRRSAGSVCEHHRTTKPGRKPSCHPCRTLRFGASSSAGNLVIVPSRPRCAGRSQVPSDRIDSAVAHGACPSTAGAGLRRRTSKSALASTAGISRTALRLYSRISSDRRSQPTRCGLVRPVTSFEPGTKRQPPSRRSATQRSCSRRANRSTYSDVNSINWTSPSGCAAISQPTASSFGSMSSACLRFDSFRCSGSGTAADSAAPTGPSTRSAGPIAQRRVLGSRAAVCCRIP